MSIDIRVAQQSHEIEAVQRQRYEIFVRERGFFATEQQHREGKLQDPLDADGDVLIARDQALLAGSVLISHGGLGGYEQFATVRRLSDRYPNQLMVISKLAIHPGYRSGTLMTRFAMALYVHCRDAHPNSLFGVIACAEDHISYFSRLGYRLLGESVNHPQGGPCHLMAVALYDLHHFHRVCPAVAKLCPRHDAESSDWFAREFGLQQPEVVA